jgi:predicted transcriptional regulator
VSPHGVHAREQTAFRLPPGLLARLRDQAEREQRTMTDIVVAALIDYLDRTEGTAGHDHAQ